MNSNNKIDVKSKALTGQRVIKITQNGEDMFLPVGLSSMNPNGGGGGTGDSAISIYRCTEYDSGNAIPAYSNITVSGVTGAGNYTLIDRNTTSGDRVWSYGNYRVGYDDTARYWCIYDATAVPLAWADSALYKAYSLLTTGEGTVSNPIIWNTAVEDTNRWQTNFYDTKSKWSSGSSSVIYYFMLKLKAGTTYTIGMPSGVGTCRSKYAELVYANGNTMWLSEMLTANEVELDCAGTYTPSADETVHVKAGCEASSQSYHGTFKLYCYPAPEVISGINLEPWEATWEAVSGSGTPSLTEVAVAERAATGVKLWSGYTGSQDETTKAWSFSDTVKKDMAVSGITPQIGKVYTEDTTLQIADTYTIAPEDGKMVALFHFDKKQSVFVDSTETCMMSCTDQCSAELDQPKFGAGRFGYNYMSISTSMSGVIQGLPELDAFTVEFWHYYEGYITNFGGPLLIQQTDEGDYGVSWISGTNYPAGHRFYIKQRYFHHALVREAGSDQVVEYIDGVPAAIHTFTPKLGVKNVWVRAGGFEPGSSGDVRNLMDELAIFNYAKYHGLFNPPTMPYPNIKSGLHEVGEPRQVEVKGVDTIVFANDPSFAITNQTATGTSRKWVNSDGSWYIYFDFDMEYCWVVANKTSAWEDGYICAAKLVTDGDVDQSATDFEPIGHSGWVDKYSNSPVQVIRLREPENNEPVLTTRRMSGAGDEAVNGTYRYNSSGTAILIYKDDTLTVTSSGFICDGYCIHNNYDANTLTPETWYLAPLSNPLNHLYTCPDASIYIKGYRWTVANGTSPAPINS